MNKITIINAYGDKNLGDAAILKVAVDFIIEAFNNKCQLSTLSESGEVKTSLGNFSNKVSAFQLPYGFAIKSTSGKVPILTKFIRFFYIIFGSLILIFSNNLFNTKLPKSGFFSYINAIKESQLIVGIGGGYFITKSIKDYFGLTLTVLPVFIAKIYKKRIIFLPISFGPFAYRHQEWLCYQSLKNTVIMARDNISLNQIRTVDKSGSIISFFVPDLALFLKPQYEEYNTFNESSYITLTAREWLSTKTKQEYYENSLSKFIDNIWDKYKISTKFVVMSQNKSEDDDNEIGQRIGKRIIHKKSYRVLTPKNVNDAQRIYANAKIAVCTRMHSAIFSSTVNTPFIVIGYGHKSLGFVENLKIKKWYIDINEVSDSNLFQIFNKLIKAQHYNKFSDLITSYHQSNVIYKKKIIDTLKYEIN